MGGWGRRFMNIAPDGSVLPCHAAETIPDMVFDNVKQRALADIWRSSAAFEKYRGTAWMPEPCRSCERREIDWGGCRCQALAISGEAQRTDPACELSSDHRMIAALAEGEPAAHSGAYIYRRFRNHRAAK